MDAPPEQEDCIPFVRIAGYLEAMQLNAPRVIDANIDDGFLLLTDLGTTQYLSRLKEDPGAAPQLYGDALQALAMLQSRGTAYQTTLAPYDDAQLRFELSLFHDWLCLTHLGIEFTADDESHWQHVCDLLVANALDQPQVFVHRDYHSRNLVLSERQIPGILDFQDAMEGPLTYDLVSLLKDCYIRWSPQQVSDWAIEFYALLEESVRDQVDIRNFMYYFELTGVQRHLKAAGIFARLKHRDGKHEYMACVPRTLGYIVELGPRFAELRNLAELIEQRCLPALEESM